MDSFNANMIHQWRNCYPMRELRLSFMKCIEEKQNNKVNTCNSCCMKHYLSHANHFLTKYKSLSIAGSQIQACLHFQQTLSIEVWPMSYLGVRIKASTGLGYTVTSSISRGSTSTFNDDINGKTSNLFIHKESNFYSEGRVIWISSFLQVK